VGIFTTSGVNGSLNVFVGDTAVGSSIAVTINAITVDVNGKVTSLGGTAPNTGDISGVTLTTDVGAKAALGTIKTAIGVVSSNRAAIGSGINRLQAAVAVLQTQSQNTQAAESTIRDANVAAEVANLTKYQILAQSGMAALGQANAQGQAVLSLLRQ